MRLYLALLLLLVFSACNNADDRKKAEGDAAAPRPVVAVVPNNKTPPRAPIINITDTTRPKQIFIYVKDTAATQAELNTKLANSFSERLAAFFDKQNFKFVSHRVAMYMSRNSPYIFEAGYFVDKAPAKLPKNIFSKILPAGKVVLAHFSGPYELSSSVYTAADEYFADRKLKPSAEPYEMYVDDPLDENGKPKDPYKVGTDIILPYK